MPRDVTWSALGRLVEPGQNVFVAGATAELAAILAAWRDSGLPNGVTLTGCQLPGLNNFTPDKFGGECRYRTSYLAPGLRDAFRRGLVDLMPMHHRAFYRWLETEASLDMAVVQVAPPDHNGDCNLGPCADLLPALASRAEVRIVAQLNPCVPRCRGGLSLPMERLDAVLHAATDLPEMASAMSGKVDAAIAELAASLIRDGATVQTGIGRLPDHVLRHVAARRHIKLHGATVSESGSGLLESGTADSIVAGYAAGNAAFYQRVATSEVAFRPVSTTHGSDTLREMHPFMALNAALEVDLLGQANCEAASGRMLSGFGGINDFMRAARQSFGGLAVIMLPAQSSDGRVSRVVSRIGDPGLVSVQRGDIDVVVTEHGIADLRNCDLDERAARLIAIAGTNFRAELTNAWRQLRARL